MNPSETIKVTFVDNNLNEVGTYLIYKKKSPTGMSPDPLEGRYILEVGSNGDWVVKMDK